MQLIEFKRFFLKNARRFSLVTLAIFAALTVWCAFQIPKLKTEYKVKQFVPLNNPLLAADEQVKAKFQLIDREPMFAILSLPEGETWLAADKMSALKAAETELRKSAGVANTLSLASVETAANSKEGLTVGRLAELVPPAEWKAKVLADPLLSPGLISADGRVLSILVWLDELDSAAIGATQASTLSLLRGAFPGADAQLGGVPVVQLEMTQVLTKELKNFLGLCLLGSVLTLLLFFRSFSSVVVPIVLMTVANVLALGLMATAGVSFSVLSTTLPVLVAITVVSMAAHTMLRYSSDWRLARRTQDNPNPYLVLYRSYRGLLLPNFLTAVTTAIGFMAISITPVPVVREYGFVVGFAIFVCWAVVITLLFPLLILFPIPEVRDWTESRASWAVWIDKYKKQVFFGSLAITAVFLWFGKSLNWSARLFDDLPAEHQARKTTEFVDAAMGGIVPLDLVVEAREENAWNDPALLRRLDVLATEWRRDARVGSVVGPQDLLRSAAQVQGKDFPSDRKEAAEYGFLYSFADVNPLKQFLTVDGKAARLSLRLRDIPAVEMEKLVEEKAAALQAAFPEHSVRKGGMAATVHPLNNEISAELIYGFWQALVLIAVVLLFIFRSVRWTLVAVLPNLVTPAILLGALNLLGTPVKPGIALIFSIALGISFDNTVYLLGRLRLLQQRSGTGRISVTKAWFQEGNLCFFSSIALSSGFFVFLASYFSLNQYFGIYMLIAIVGGLLGDLILMPAFLLVCPWLLDSNFRMFNLKEKPMKKAVAAGLALTMTVTATSPLWAAKVDPNDAKSILSQVAKNVDSQDEVASIKMTITEADGAKKDRELEIRRKGKEDKQKVMVRMAAPADLKGTALLSVSKGKESDQWLYLPSSKQTRRIVSGKKNGSFMDSELSYEDMGASSDANFESKVLKQDTQNGRKFAVVENVAKGESAYGKILLWVDLENYLVGKMEYYDKNMKLLKVSTFSGYKKYDNGVWRAQKVQVANVQNKRGTVLELSNLKLNKGLEDAEFTESALSDEE